MERASFTDSMLERRTPHGLDVTTTLRDFAIVTYAVPPERLVAHIAPGFTPEVIETNDGHRALVSVVPFRDTAFRLAGCPSPGIGFGQTNYRAYVRDRESGERAVWFFGTALDSATVAIPRRVWQLPWHRTQIRFDCRIDTATNRYNNYSMRAEGNWGTAALDVIDTGSPVDCLPGFPDTETAMVVLTHPLTGVFYRRDGDLGTYSVWHDRLSPTLGECRLARFAVLNALDIVPFGEQLMPHSILLQSEIDFTIYLPPRRLTRVAAAGA